MHEQTLLNHLQALASTAAGVASYTSDAKPQAGNARLESTQFHHSTTWYRDCQPASRVVWVKAWTNVLCVLGMLAFDVSIVLLHTS